MPTGFLIHPTNILVSGHKYLDDCPAQSWIPIYLMVCGILSCVRFVIELPYNIWQQRRKRQGTDTGMSCNERKKQPLKTAEEILQNTSVMLIGGLANSSSVIPRRSTPPEKLTIQNPE